MGSEYIWHIIITIYLAKNKDWTSDYPATQFTVVSQLPDSVKLNKESCLTLRTNNGSRLLIQTVWQQSAVKGNRFQMQGEYSEITLAQINNEQDISRV